MNELQQLGLFEYRKNRTGFTADKIQKRRESKKQQIEAFFGANLGKKFSSRWLHGQWGSALRTRISDINLDPAAKITIHNEVGWEDNVGETSLYWSALR